MATPPDDSFQAPPGTRHRAQVVKPHSASMFIWLKWLLVAAISATGIALSAEPLTEYNERRNWRRFAIWHCPNCGSLFGPQDQHAFWSRCDTHHGHQIITSGPILKCQICEQESRMIAEGKSFPE